MNYSIEKGGFEFDQKSEKFSVNENKVQKVIVQLVNELLMIEALGDYGGAKKLIDKYRHISPEMQICLDKLEDVPVDIRPEFVIENKLKN